MNIDKQKRLEAHSWKVASAKEFLGLYSEKVAEVENQLNNPIWKSI